MPPGPGIPSKDKPDDALLRLGRHLSRIETYLQAAGMQGGDLDPLHQAEEALQDAKIELENTTRQHEQVQRSQADQLLKQEQIEQMLQQVNEFKQNEDLLHAILENVPAGLAVLSGPELIFRFANRTYRAFTPNHKLNPIGHRYEEIWPSVSGFQIRPSLLRVMETRETIQTMRHKHKYHRGLARYFSVHLSPLTWEGKPAVLSVLWENTPLVYAQHTAEEAAEKLRYERLLLDQIIQEAPIGIAILKEPEHRYLLVNAYYQDISSAKGNLIGRTFAEVWPEVKDQLVASLDHVYQTRTILRAVDAPYRIQRPGGMVDSFFTYTFIPLKDQAGKVDRIMIIAMDTTEQVNTRRQVEAQRDQLLTLIDNMNDEVWFCDQDGKIELANLAAAKNLGYSSVEELLHPADVIANDLEILNQQEAPRPVEDSPLLQALKGKAVRGEEIVRNKKTGERKYREFNAAPIESKNGEILGVVAVTRDISQRKQLERRLQDNNRLLKSIIDNAPVGIILTDEKAHVLMINPVAEILFPSQALYEKEFGYESGLLILHPDGSPYDPRDLPLTRSALDGETFIAQEISVILPDGQKRYLLFNSTPLRNNSGQITGAVGTFHDITSRKQIETELEQSKSELEQRVHERTEELEVANEELLAEIDEREKTTQQLQTSQEKLSQALKDEQAMRSQLIQAEKNTALARMVASVAHELNNPIQTIQNCMFLLEEEVISNPAAVDYTKMAVSETQRVARLVAQLRELYRPTKDNAPKSFDILELLDNVGLLLAPHLQNHQVKWYIRSIATEPVFVTGILDQIKQVFLNLCLNAIDAMEPNGGLLEVIVSKPRTDKVCITFKDTGAGIQPENLHHLFEPFFTTKEKGSGLGLSICHEIIRNHNGEITVKSQPGEGSAFSVWLPVD